MSQTPRSAVTALTALLLSTTAVGAVEQPRWLVPYPPASEVSRAPNSNRLVGSESEDPAQTHAISLADSTPNPQSIVPMATNWNGSAQQTAVNYFNWDMSATGAGVIIGIVDSGIDLDHPEFTGRILSGTCFSGGTAICTAADAAVGGDPGIFPSQLTHGTHVAGIAAGSTVGIATAAKILPVKVCDTYSSSCPGDVDSGIVWASQHGAKVINLSLGGPTLSSSDVLSASAAIKNGAVLVVAAGNSGNSVAAGGFLAGAALKDGVRGAMIVVGATGLNNEIASFSQTPGSTCELSGGVNYCMRDYFVVAPGQGIVSAVGGGGYGVKSGTSMATPFVTGVAAVIKGAWSYLTPYDIADIIFKTADDLGSPGPDNVYGRGAVDIKAAMSPIGGAWVSLPTSPTPTPTPTPTPAPSPGGGKGKGKSGKSSSEVTGALATISTGALSAAFRSSSLLKNVELVDIYGRTFSVDLTQMARSSGISLGGMERDPFRSLEPFAMTSRLESAAVSMSGFVEHGTAPEGLDANARLIRNGQDNLQNFALSISPSERLSFDFGHNLYLSGSMTDLGAANGDAGGVFLSASALNSPYLALSNGSNFSGVSYSPSDGVRLRAGYAAVAGTKAMEVTVGALDHSALANDAIEVAPRQARSMVASASWDFSQWGSVGITGTRTVEQNGVLGGMSAGAFAVANQTATSAVGFSARMGLGGGWSTNLAWNEGITRLDVAPDGLFSDASALRSRAYGIALQRRGLFGGDTLGFAVTRPLSIYSGSARLRAATGADSDGNLSFGAEHLSLAAVRPETDLETGYVTRLFGGMMRLQFSAAYQMDLNGEPGQNAVAGFAHLGLRM
jgi:subtilisin family serine protease